MAVGYAFNGTCYPDGATALTAFNLGVMNTDGAHINTLTSSSVAGTPPVITYNISSRTLATTTATAARTGTITLKECDYSFMQTKDLPDMVLIAVLLFAAFMGLRTGFRP